MQQGHPAQCQGCSSKKVNQAYLNAFVGGLLELKGSLVLSE